LRGRILVIAGSDPSGGAGIQADIKTITALNGYAMTAITALTAQNTTGVFGVEDVPVAFITDQIKAVVSDIGVDCIKIGMLHTEEIITEVRKTLAIYTPDVPIVFGSGNGRKGRYSFT
jgi:Hydroxymethylpyrimidine/phosphomethylpyrimidine kinase